MKTLLKSPETIFNDSKSSPDRILQGVSWEKLCDFSRAFTDTGSCDGFPGFYESTLYMDDSDGFKLRRKFCFVDGFWEVSWAGSIEKIPHKFNGKWWGFEERYGWDAYLFVSCNENVALIIPDDQGAYSIYIKRAEGRESCQYEEFFNIESKHWRT